MGLEALRLAEGRLAAIEVPPAVEVLVCEAERRIERFVEASQDEPLHAFVPSDFRAVYRALAWCRAARLAPGRTFLEWGSGFGVVALLAASLGFEAAGIEVQASLVRAAEDLARHAGLEAEFVCGSFVPEGARVRADAQEELAWLDESAAPAYEELGLDTRDYDLVFAYPWPGEQEAVYELFERHAARGALLLTFHGQEGLRLHRRV